MYNRVSSILFFIILSAITLVSCQKEIDGTVFSGGVNPATQKPKVGTTWTYRYYIYHQDGSLYQSYVMTHKAKSEDTLGGEKWLNVIDVDADTTVYYLNVKADGLYQYANNNSNLFCKYPAAIGDNYNTFNEGSAENFIVRGVKDTLPTGIGDILTNYYEGYKSNILIDLVWYNNNAWIVRKSQYRNRSVIVPVFYKYSTLFLDQIVY
ncbi:MAG: hypothetical protein KA409_12845 [Ferruginibacter sp.]|nr:hypothetical protein [Ferruginibacter sp.]